MRPFYAHPRVRAVFAHPTLRSPRTRRLLLGAVCVAALFAGVSQIRTWGAPSPPPAPPVHLAADAPRAVTVEGIVQTILLSPRGDADGFLLSDGTRILFTPHLSAALSAVVVGDRVKVEGRQADGVPVIDASAITNVRTGERVVREPLHEPRPRDAGPRPRGPRTDGPGPRGPRPGGLRPGGPGPGGPGPDALRPGVPAPPAPPPQP